MIRREHQNGKTINSKQQHGKRQQKDQPRWTQKPDQTIKHEQA